MVAVGGAVVGASVGPKGRLEARVVGEGEVGVGGAEVVGAAVTNATQLDPDQLQMEGYCPQETADDNALH